MALNQSNLPTTQNFKFEDYPDAPEYFAQFLNALNYFVGPINQMVNGGITYQNLMIPQLFTKVITTPASGSVMFNFTNPLKIQPKAVVPGFISVTGNPSSHPSAATSVYWHLSQNSIYIDNIVGLSTSTSYTITLIIL